MDDRTAHRFGDTALPRRFWDKAEVDANGCWIWRAYRNAEGYGRFRFDGRQQMAHRVTFETLVTPIPVGFVLDHLCRVRECCNPAHLEVATQQDNVLRGVGHAARNAVVTHCTRGHEYDDENTYVYQRKDGRVGRYCRACSKIRRAEQAAA